MTSLSLSVVKNMPANAGNMRDMGSTPGSAGSPGEGHGNPLQYCCLESPRGQREESDVLQSIGLEKSRTRLKHARSWHPVPSLHGKQKGEVEAVTHFIFLGSKITADSDRSHNIKRHSLLGRKAVTNLDSIFKSRDITLLTKVCAKLGFF